MNDAGADGARASPRLSPVPERACSRVARDDAESSCAARDEVARLRGVNAQVEIENRALREAVAARDSFIAITGFELRNPMGAIALGVSNLAFQLKRTDEVSSWIGERVESLDVRALPPCSKFETPAPESTTSTAIESSNRSSARSRRESAPASAWVSGSDPRLADAA
jgi:hypothetical protein